MADQQIDIDDIFALSSPADENQQKIALKNRMIVLRNHMSDVVTSAPTVNGDSNVVEQEQWCRLWNDAVVRDYLLFRCLCANLNQPTTLHVIVGGSPNGCNQCAGGGYGRRVHYRR
jgi:hypothetical protein